MFYDQITLNNEIHNFQYSAQPERRLSVFEDAPVGTILTRVVATDADAEPVNSVLTYVLTSGDPSLFSVNETTGEIRLDSALDFETEKEHRLTVEAGDVGQLACQFVIQVTVLDVNDNPPVFDPVQIQPIPEDAPIGSLVGKVTARDRDTGLSRSYSIDLYCSLFQNDFFCFQKNQQI